MENNELKRSLGPWQLLSLGVGAIIGAGLFSLTGIVAAENAGPAVIVSFALAAVACAFCALCYAEYASIFPVAGSAYTYTYATLGRFMAWIIGWDLVLEYSLTSATVAVSWSSYAAKLLEGMGIHVPLKFATSPFERFVADDGSLQQGLVNFPAALVVILASLVLIRGTKGSSLLNTILVIIKVGVIVLFIALGWSFINQDNYHPFLPENKGAWGEFGWSGIVRGAAVVFFSFIGFDAVSTAAQESKNPQRDLPIGIIGSLAIATLLYILFSYVLTGLKNYTSFTGDASPVASAFAVTGYKFLNVALIVAILAGYSSVILVMLLGQSRVAYAISKDKLIPPFFSSVHRRFQTPWKTNIFFMVLVALLAAFVPLKELGHMVSIGTLFAFSLVSVGVIILRYKRPDLPRPFKVPGVPFVPIVGILICLFLMLGLPGSSWIRLLIWMCLGLALFWLYGAKRKKDDEVL